MARTFLLAVLIGSALLAGCEGDTGPAGPAGPPGPPGAAGPPGTTGGASSGIPISSAQDTERLTAEVTSVTVPTGGGPPVVTFKLTNDLTQGLKGLLPADVRFTIAQLKPGVGGGSSDWRSYVTRMDAAQVQATAETAEAARFVDNGDGTYKYTFKSALTAYANAPTYDGTLTHRVGVEVRNNAPTNNGPLDFIPAGGTVSTQRLIVDNDNCQACHDVLEFHGGARFDTQYCVTCHNPSTLDGQTNNSVDMKVMIHKIHGAAFLKTQTTVPPYTIVGNNNTSHPFGDIVYPQDVRNCTTCHDENDADTPQASNWRTVANRAACGTCHADIDFAAGGHPAGLPFADDTQCLSCHGPDSSVTGSRGQFVRIEAAHQIPLDVKSEEFAYQVVSVTDTSNGPLETGDTPRVTIKVVNPKNSNTPYDIQDPAGPFKQSGASLRADLAWTGTEFSNVGNPANTQTTAPFQPVAVNFLATSGVTKNADTSFTADAIGFVLPNRAALLPAADPALLTGGLVAIVEGKPRFDPDGAGPEPLANVKVTAGGKAEAWDGVATTRPNIVDINRCNECHNVLSLHGDGRTGSTQLCTTCHNPNATDVNRHAGTGGCAPGTPDVSIDFPVLIHSIHASARRTEQGAPPFTVCGYNNTFYDFSHVHYPGQINNCENCHVPPTSSNPSYYGRDPAKRLAITTRAGADRISLIDDTADSPTAGTCVACHATSTAMTHMKQNGGVFGALKQPTGQVVGQAETCSLCHGPGATADLREVHKISFYPLNN